MTNEQKIKNSVKRALELYNSFYGDIIASLSVGQFSSSLAKKSEVDEIVSLMSNYGGEIVEIDGITTKAEISLKKKLQGMLKSGFAKNIQDVFDSISDDVKFHELESAFNKGTLSDSDAQMAIELLKLVNSETLRAKKLSRTGADASRQCAEAVITKAIKSPSIYASADFDKLMPYLESALTAKEKTRYIRQVGDIARLHRTALESIQEVGIHRSGMELEMSFATQELPKEMYRALTKLEPNKELDGVINGLDGAVIESIKDRSKSISESIKDIEELEKKAMEEISKHGEHYKSVVRKLEETLDQIAEFDEMYTSAHKGLSDVVAEKTKGKEPVITGRFEGKAGNRSMDVETGEYKSESEDVERPLTDLDLLMIIYDRTMKHTAFLTKELKDGVTESKSLKDAEKIITNAHSKMTSLINGFDAEYNEVIKFYDLLLDYTDKFVNVREYGEEASKKFLAGFNPKASISGCEYFDADTLAKIRKYGLEAMRFEHAFRADYFEHLSTLFGFEVVEYFNDIDPKVELKKPIRQVLDIREITKEMVVPTFEKVEMHALKSVDNYYAGLKAISQDGVGARDMEELLKDKNVVSALQAFIPFISFEVSFGALSAMIDGSESMMESDEFGLYRYAAYVSDSYSCMQRIKAISNNKEGMFMTDGLRDYIKLRLPVMRQALNKVEIMKKKKESSMLDSMTSLFQMVVDCRSILNYWENSLSDYEEKKKDRDTALLARILKEESDAGLY